MINVYLPLMFIVFIIAHYGINSKYSSKALSKYCAVVIFIILTFISGFRSQYSIGDTPFYAHSYRLLGDNPIIKPDDKDKGFLLIMILLNQITDNPQILIFLSALITNLFIVIVLYRYSKPFELGIYLYFGTLLYYVTMNGIRQSLAAAMLFWAVGFIIKGQWKKYFILVLLISTIHGSALVFIPLYFLVRKEAWTRTFWMTLIIAIVMFIAFRPMLGAFVRVLDNTSYSNYGKDMVTNSSSVNAIRVVITLVPLVLAYFVRDRLKDEWPDSNIFIYMSLINFIFMLFSIQYLYFYRMCIYFDLFNLILIPRLLCFYSKKQRLALSVYTIIFYFIFCYSQVLSWNDYYRNILFTY